MEGLSAGPGEPARLGRAVAHFDRLATRIAVRGSSSPGGTATGFLLGDGSSPGPAQTQLQDWPLSALWSRLLMDMAADLNGDVPERPNTGEGLLALSEAKTRLMEVLLPQAARYAEDRAKFVQRYSRERRRLRRKAISSPSLDDAKLNSEAGRNDDGASDVQVGKTSTDTPRESQARKQSLPPYGAMKARRLTSASITSVPVDGDNGYGHPVSSPQDVTFGGVESVSGNSSPRDSSILDEDEEPWELEGWETGEEASVSAEREEEDQAAKTIYRHTFAVLKGELLSSQLLEPEVMHFIAQFSDLFRTLFTAYADVPVTATEGHMTLTAFLRFCDDFDLFPDMVDFQTLQWLYHTADGVGEVLVSVPTPSAEDSSTPGLRKGPDGREGGRRASVDVKEGSSPSHRASIVQAPEPNKRGALVRDSSTSFKKRRSSMSKQQEDGILFCGKWLKSHLAWLTKDPTGMNSEEKSLAAILWAMEEWLQDMRMQVQEVCSFLLPPGSASICEEELCVIVDSMQLEDTPSHAEIHRLVAALVPHPPPSCQEKLTIDISLLQMAIMAVGKQKERRNRVVNCFMKDFSKMSREESNALVFFRELWYTIEYKKMSPEQLFREFDADRNGTLSPEELTIAVHQVLKFMPFPSAALTIEGPFAMLDLDADGKITLEEFVSVMRKVRQAREMRKLYEEDKHPIFLSTKAPPAPNSPLPRRTFFGHRAFTECLVKVALEHLGYHSSPSQAEQPSFIKAMWLYLYLHWKFEGARDRILGQSQAELERTPSIMPPGSRCPTYQSPLKRLMMYPPELFASAPAVPPPEELRPAWAPARDPCSVCNSSATRLWGNPTCPHCSQADPVLAACWSRGRPSGRGHRSLDSMLLAVETDG